MGDPYRGFHELPRAVFESLREVADVAVKQAIEKANPPAPSPRRPRESFSWCKALQYIAGRVLPDRGFTGNLASGGDVIMDQFNSNLFRVTAWHLFYPFLDGERGLRACGSRVDLNLDLTNAFSWDKQLVFSSILDDMEREFVCYCVPRPPPPPRRAPSFMR